MYNSIVEQLKAHEGERLHPYRCTAGKITIGIGRNLDDKGITKEESLYLLHNDISECVDDLLTIFPNFHDFSANRKRALTDMRFNLGPQGFRSFKGMIAAIERGDWEDAARHALNSKWATQVQKSRVDTVIEELRDR
jgi:lysozyme